MVATQKRILVVDDESIVRDSYELALAEAGYDVRTVASGREAVQACRAERFDAVLADLKMPDMDGLEVARVVSRESPGVRVVIVTGYPSQESAEQAARLGVAGYLEKPLSPERLSAATAAALARPAGGAAAETEVASPAQAESLEPQEAESEEAAPGEVAEPSLARVSSTAARKAVLVTAGFLGGVMVAYLIAPVHALAYLMVGAAIASGTVLGLFSDALFARRRPAAREE